MSYACFAITTFDTMLGTLDHLAARAIEAGMDDAVLSAKLAEDMFPLELQFRVAINQVLLALRQVGGQTPPLDETTYRSLAEVRERIAAARDLLKANPASGWAAPDAEVDLTLPHGMRFVMSAEDDIRDWLLPNFYFHAAMVYALLRREGLAIGKMDFLPHMARHVRADPAP